MDRAQLMDHLEHNSKVFQDKKVKKAFEAVDRADFVGEDYAVEAYEDYALPIGSGQEMLQPTRMAFMLELLEIEEGNSVLNVGSGSGWSTALLSSMVGPTGKVFGVEIVPELVSQAKAYLAKYDLKNAQICEAGDGLGLPDKGPYDRIFVGAAADEFPDELTVQLKEGGIAIVPVDEAIWKVTKGKGGKLSRKEFSGFRFAPLAV